MGMKLTRERQVSLEKLASTEMLQDNVYFAEDHTCVQKSIFSWVWAYQGTSPYCWNDWSQVLLLVCYLVSKLQTINQQSTTFTENCITQTSGVARSLVLAGHLLALSARLRDMSRMNIVLWPGMCPARPSLRKATDTNSGLKVFYAMGDFARFLFFQGDVVHWLLMLSSVCVCVWPNSSVRWSYKLLLCKLWSLDARFS